MIDEIKLREDRIITELHKCDMLEQLNDVEAYLLDLKKRHLKKESKRLDIIKQL